MRIKRVNRYYCDFCNKGGCSAGHMKNHEKHCTMNPNRHCRMCDLLGGSFNELADLIALMPGAPNMVKVSGLGGNYEHVPHGYNDLVDEAVSTVYDKTEGCPACVLAAIRQSKTMTYYNYQERAKEVFDQYAEDQRENVAY